MGKKSKLQIIERSVEDLQPYEFNARTHSGEQVQQIAASILEFGFTNPVLIDENLGLIAGHGRCEAAKLLKLETVPTIMLEGLTAAQQKAYIIADNQLALNAGWDEKILAAEIDTLALLNFELPLLGFDEKELEYLEDIGKGLSLESTEPEKPAPPTGGEKPHTIKQCPNCAHEWV